MKTITKFDKTAVAVVVRPEVTKALEVLKQYGIVATVGTIRFSENSLRFKVEARVLGERTSGSVQVTEPVELLDLRAFSKSHPEYGDLVNRPITLMGKSFDIVGYKPSRRKFPFNIRGIAGGNYKCSTNQVRAALGLPIFGNRY